MAQRVKIAWNKNAFAQVRTLPGVMNELNTLAGRVADAAGDGYEVRPAQATGGRVRGRASVGTTDFESRLDNARNNTLVRALGSAKGPS